jgi:hypothetical protein
MESVPRIVSNESVPESHIFRNRHVAIAPGRVHSPHRGALQVLGAASASGPWSVPGRGWRGARPLRGRKMEV